FNFYTSKVTAHPKVTTFINDPGAYATATDENGQCIRDNGKWATEMDVKAAATLFQRPIYLYRPPYENAPLSEYRIWRFDPYQETASKWSMTTTAPNAPVVLMYQANWLPFRSD